MQTPRILLTRAWPRAVEQQMAARFEVACNPTDEPMNPQALARAFDAFDIVCPTVSDRIDAGVIGGLAGAPPRCKLIANYGVGFDHIDLASARAQGIAVSNTPGVLTDATADLALTLLLMATRRAGEGERELRAGRWTGWRPTHLIGAALKEKVLGIVGFGRIGQATAARARHGFGMRIAYHARAAADPAIAGPLGAQFHPDLASLLGASDMVSLHIPGGAQTANLIDAAALALMKPGSYLINTARGGVIDHEALADALKSGHLAGAGLDVYPHEPHVPESLLALENVVLLPHLGSANAETRIAMGLRALANVEAFVAGKALPDQIA